MKSAEQSTETIGTRVRAIRESRNMSREDLAACAGLAFPTVGSVERDDHKPYIRTLARIAAVLDVTIADLVEGVRE